MLNFNEFNNRKEVVMIDYIGIIKNPTPFLLKKIYEEWRYTIGTYIDLSKIDGLDLHKLMYLTIKSPEENILKHLSIREFNYNSIYNKIYNKYNNLYKDSELLVMGNAIHMMILEKMVGKIIIYSETYDDRIMLDIGDTFKKNKIYYVSNESRLDVIKKNEDITTIITTDINLVNELVDNDLANYRSFLIPAYGYNIRIKKGTKDELELKIDDLGSKMKKNVFKLNKFTPVNIDSSYFV